MHSFRATVESRVSRRSLLSAVILSAAAVGAPLLSQQPVTSGEYLTLRGADTVSLERFSRDARSLTGEFVWDGLHLRYTAQLRADQSVQRFEFTADRGGHPETGRLDFTSTGIKGERSLQGVTRVVDVATPTAALPLVWYSTALLEQIVRATRPAAGQDANVPVFINLFSETAATETMLLRRVAHDSILVLIRESQVQLAVADDGSVSGASRVPQRAQPMVVQRIERRAVSSVSLAGLFPFLCRYADYTESLGPTTIADLPDGLSSDGRGPYIQGSEGVAGTGVSNFAGLGLYQRRESTNNPRKLTVNLNNPVAGGGGTPLGIITAGGLHTQWHKVGIAVQNLHDIPVGGTVTAAQMNISVNINGHPHLLQMGPQANGHCHTVKNLVNGTGTSSGTIYRPSQTKWVMDLPAGSVGRLFDIDLGGEHAVDKGLYYVRLHYEIGN